MQNGSIEATFDKQKKAAWIFSVLYVGLGTLAVLTSYGCDKYYFEGSGILLLLTLPVSVISSAIRFGTADYFVPVIITQLCLLWPAYKLVFIILTYRYRKRQRL